MTFGVSTRVTLLFDFWSVNGPGGKIKTKRIKVIRIKDKIIFLVLLNFLIYKYFYTNKKKLL